jgi:hypothetical protein
MKKLWAEIHKGYRTSKRNWRHLQELLGLEPDDKRSFMRFQFEAQDEVTWRKEVRECGAILNVEHPDE